MHFYRRHEQICHILSKRIPLCKLTQPFGCGMIIGDKSSGFIFGKESTGIPKEILKKDLEHCMRIPMTDGVRALNVSNSVAIVIYEALRQQNYRGLLFAEPSDDGHKGPDYLERK